MYRAMLDTYLNHSLEWMDTQGQSALFYRDTHGQMDDVTGNGNIGLKKRTELTANSATFEMQGQLHTDVCMQTKALLNKVFLCIFVLSFCIYVIRLWHIGSCKNPTDKER